MSEIPEGTVVDFPVASVIIPESRQRTKAEADAVLVASIETDGLLNPIIIHENGVLVAGERRLDAHRKLGRSTIRCTVFESLSPIVAMRIELQENLARKQLSWQDETAAVAGYHALRLGVYPAWNQKGTANDLGISEGQVSKILVVARELGDEDVRSCPTFTGAFNLISARADRARIAAQSRGLDIGAAGAFVLPPPIPIGASKEEKTRILLQHADLSAKGAETVDELTAQLSNIQAGKLAAKALEIAREQETQNDLIITADFMEWVGGYSGPRFDVLHVDFPYGIGYTGARTRRTGKSHIAPIYADDPDIYFRLLDCLLDNQDRVAFPAAHCLFWFDMRFYQVTVDAFRDAGWQLVQDHPLIWTKGYEGIASDVNRRPRHCYETALLFARGDRKISHLDKDWFDCPVGEKLHLNQKPLLMLKHFLNIIVDQHTAVFDPTCGSGAALAAVAQLKCARFLGVELDPNNAEVARFLLQRHAPPAEKPDVA